MNGSAPHMRVGRRGEDLAADHLVSRGMKIVARNWRVADGDLRGELDIVAVDPDQGLTVIVEVKTRSGRGFGGPFAAVTPRKQHQLRRVAAAFLVEADLPYRHVRFDVIGIVLTGRTHELIHLEGVL